MQNTVLLHERLNFGALRASGYTTGSKPIIEDEIRWRSPASVPTSPSAILATRWRSASGAAPETGAEASSSRHIVMIAMRSMDFRLMVGGRTAHDGITASGTVHVTGPDVPARAVFRGPFDVLHLHVPSELVNACADELLGSRACAPWPETILANDPIIEGLARSLVQADAVGGAFGLLYAESLSHAIIVRLLSLTRDVGANRPNRTGLVRWHLKRAIDFIESRLAEPLSLADVAAASGLTRMYFAAQFRAATGVRPHEYILRRRIDRACEILSTTGMPLVDVAFSVGFQSQSHFTTVFKRFTGEPPNAWRQSRRISWTPDEPLTAA